MNRLVPILQTTGGLIFLQQGPQNMPGDRQTLVTIIILYLVMVVLSHIPLDVNPVQALLVGVLEAAILAGFFHAVLTIAKKPGRFVQSYGSVLMVSTVMNLLSVPSKAIVIPQWQAIFQAAQEQQDTAIISQMPLSEPNVFILLVLFVWFIVTMAYIFRHALEIRMSNAVFVALIYPMIFFVFAAIAG